ncbi:amidohydrolase family protein [Candidatus Formimonas warabiya]|uniref:Amidohydrolase n=1 Tax=Formimonas warabiya TaxID=1761012 RepID=A0A3G1KVA3_FORW1|nr:amidohydrolase family protein [Candidatus Formimonas warabiya]ATW26366.1 amidohydrolase [Candidatus Formimonas warabiya]
MLIDVHTHCFPDHLALKAIPVLAKRAGITAYANGTIEVLKKSMGCAGIDKSVILPIATKPEQTSVINRWVAGIEDSTIIPFATLHPDLDHWQEELRWIVEQGIKGVKFHPYYQDFYVDEKRMFPIYEKVFQSGLIVLFHAGIDMGFPDPCRCTPLQLKKVVEDFPGARIIAAHMGGYLFWDEVEKFLVGKSLFLDTSFSFHKLGAAGMERLIQAHGAEKILFGTDSPWTDPSKEVSQIKSLKLTDHQLDLILGGNAQRLLKL